MRRFDLDEHIRQAWPERMLNLNDRWMLSWQPYRNYVGVTVVRIMAVVKELKATMGAEEWDALRVSLATTFNHYGLLSVRGNNPNPFGFAEGFLPEWRGFYCHSNCMRRPSSFVRALRVRANSTASFWLQEEARSP